MVAGERSPRFLVMLPRRLTKPSFFFLSTEGDPSVLREAPEASLTASARGFLFFLRMVCSSRVISPSEADDLLEPVRLIEPMWKGDPERNGERSVWRVRRRREGAGIGGGGGGGGPSSSRIVLATYYVGSEE